jgi:hypothetical protein
VGQLEQLDAIDIVLAEKVVDTRAGATGLERATSGVTVRADGLVPIGEGPRRRIDAVYGEGPTRGGRYDEPC